MFITVRICDICYLRVEKISISVVFQETFSVCKTKWLAINEIYIFYKFENIETKFDILMRIYIIMSQNDNPFGIMLLIMGESFQDYS